MATEPRRVEDSRKPLPELVGEGQVQPKAAPIVGPAPVKPATFRASIHTAPSVPLPAEFVKAAEELEKALAAPLWFIVHRGSSKSPVDLLNDQLAEAFFMARTELSKDGQIALVIDSPGGFARATYKIAKTLRNHSGGFTAVVPRYAKSAATLLTLGADKIVMMKDAELGPLDAHFFDVEREDKCSALDEVQALERLNAAALEAIDYAVMFMRLRSGKKIDTLLPIATNFVTGMMRPLLEKIDTVHYSQMQRMLKEGEDYAVRLLQPRFSQRDAERIARRLVEHYSEHGFVIDFAEADEIGLQPVAPTDEQVRALDEMMPFLTKLSVIGKLEEAQA